MERRNWKVAHLARAAELPGSTLYSIWDDKQLSWPQPLTLAKLAHALDTTVSSLLRPRTQTPAAIDLELLIDYMRKVEWTPTRIDVLRAVLREILRVSESSGPPADPLFARLARIKNEEIKAVAREEIEALVAEAEEQDSEPEKGPPKLNK